MRSPVSLAELVGKVAREADSDRALDMIAWAAMESSQSRNVLVAVVNEEIGDFEVRSGAGSRSIPLTEVLATSLAEDEQPANRVRFADTSSEWGVPVHDQNGRVRAMFSVESDLPDAYGPEDRAFLYACADLVSIVLDREGHLEREEALIRVGNALSSVATESGLIDQVMQVAEEVLRLQACSIFLIDPTVDRFMLRGSSGRLRERVNEISYERGEGFTGWVCDTGQPILLDDPMSDKRWRGKFVEFPSEQVASFLAVPIVSRGTSIGAIRALRQKSENPFYDNRFRADDMRLLGAIAEQLAIGLESVRITENAIRSERMVAWGELSAKSSHMIGNRVFALKGDINELSHTLEDELPSIETLRELAASLGTNVRRIEEILQDFRDFVSATRLTRTPTDLNALVQETVAEVFPRRTKVELDVDLDMRLPKFGLDGKRLRRAVSELIENSLVYMEEGHLSVRTRMVASVSNDRTRASRVSSFALVEIADSGPGVEPDKKALIFQPFYSGRVRGMGLGLSIVKGIVDAHGGYVYESGHVGEGATFNLLLPIQD